MSRHIEYDLKNEIYHHYQKLSLAFYRRHNTGDLMNRVTEDVSRVRMYLGPGIMYTINTVVLFVMVIYAMLTVNVRLAIFSVLPLPILALIIYYVNNTIQLPQRKNTGAVVGAIQLCTGKFFGHKGYQIICARSVCAQKLCRRKRKLQNTFHGAGKSAGVVLSLHAIAGWPEQRYHHVYWRYRSNERQHHLRQYCRVYCLS